MASQPISQFDLDLEEYLKSEIMQGQGEMAALMRSTDWSKTALGPVQTWPTTLRTALNICLTSRFPIVLWWGKDLRLLYNDGWRPVLGITKHPAALGRPGAEVWPEIWNTIGPMLKGVLETGRATWEDDQLLVLDRNEYTEEAYFTYSYSPIRVENGEVGGVFSAVHETTQRVIGQRRLHSLRDLATQASRAQSAEEACTMAATTLEKNPADVPFALFYLLSADGATAELVAQTKTTGLRPPSRVNLKSGASAIFAEALGAKALVQFDDVASRFGQIKGFLDLPTKTGVVLPLRSAMQERITGFLVCGVNPARELDEDYKSFFDTMASHVSTGIANARAYEEERKRAETLAQLDHAKTTFFSNVSHELRTPLTLMLGPVEDALAAERDNGQRARLTLLHRNSLRLLKLVNTLLDFSRIEAGRVKPSFRPTDIGPFTGELVSVFRSAIEQAGLRLTLDLPRVKDQIFVDRDMWEKIVLNLISNAFKSTFEGEIKVSLRSDGKYLTLAVQDTGTGIPEAELPHLFERFHRVEGAQRRTHEGSGIGLALVHELARMHGGSINVESRMGKGTTFVVTIPVGRSHLPQDWIKEDPSQSTASAGSVAYAQEAMSWLSDVENEAAELDRFSSNEVEGSAGAAESAGPRPRVLLADDNRDMRQYVERLLAARFDVSVAENGAQALEMARKGGFDLVLTDIMMPQMDGFQLLAKLRQEPLTQTTPVILLSARAGEESRVEGMEAGADDYLVKPFTAKELLARVDAHIRIAQFRKNAITEQQQLRQELAATKSLVADAVQNMSDAFMIFDRQWRCTSVNRAVLDMVRCEEHELIGRTLWDIFPELTKDIFFSHCKACMTGRDPVHFEFEVDRTRRVFSFRLYPGPNGGVVIYATDITEKLFTETALRLKQEQLLLAQRAAGIGIWELDLDTEEMTISEEFAHMVGLPRYVSRLHYTEFLETLFLSSDQQSAKAALQSALRSKKEFNLQLRLRRPDGTVALVSKRGKVFFNQGNPKLLGVLIDISRTAKSARGQAISPAQPRKTAKNRPSRPRL